MEVGWLVRTWSRLEETHTRQSHKDMLLSFLGGKGEGGGGQSVNTLKKTTTKIVKPYITVNKVKVT